MLIACGGASDSSDQTTTATASTVSTTATTAGQTNTGTDGAPSADCLHLTTTLSAASTLGLEDAGVDFVDPSTFSSPVAQAAMAAAAGSLNEAAVTEASESISAYIDSVCD